MGAPFPTADPFRPLEMQHWRAGNKGTVKAISCGRILRGALCAVGKTSLAQVVAGLTGQELVQIALTSSTDTSDLLGGFEQLEPRRQLQASLSSNSHPAVLLLALYTCRFGLWESSR